MTNHRILVVSPHEISERMTGPGIRYWEISKCLGTAGNVTLAAPNSEHLPSNASFQIVSYNKNTLEKWVRENEIVLIQGFLMAEYPVLQAFDGYLVVDLYDVYPIEELATRPPSRLGVELHRSTITSALIQLLRGDFFICATQRQRDFWLGMLTALGRVNPLTYQKDPTLHSLIDIVQSGIPANLPVKSKQVLKGVIPGIEKDDKVVIWGGGIYDWLDPLTPILAIEKISRIRNDVKLFFMATMHPSHQHLSSKSLTQAIQTSKDKGLIDRYVFFNPDWVPYESRQEYLLEADLGISSSPNHLETHFSPYRARLMDYVWAGLPIVTTRGDSLEDEIVNYQIGKVVEPQSVDSFAEAILSILNLPDYKKTYQEKSKLFASSLSWNDAVLPLAQYCSAPRRAADNDLQEANQNLQKALTGKNSLVRKSFFSIQEEGLEGFWRRAQTYLKRRANK